MKNIGVFVCWCGSNIAEVIDIDKVMKDIANYPGVAHCEDYKYLCSSPGQEMIKDKIREKKLSAVVIAACSPFLHEATFRRAIQDAGLNLYMCEITNIREHCSWVHRQQKEEATEKAISLIQANIEKVKQNEELYPEFLPLTKKALIIGGGIAGITAALSLANSGIPVILMEKEPSIGGKMSQLSETFPTLDCSQCILTPRTVEVSQHKNIKLLTYCEIDEVSGTVGNFTAKIRKKASYIDREKCTGCGICIEKCPVKIPSKHDRYLSHHKAIYVPYPQAVPNKPVIDAMSCRYLTEKKCGVCKKLCEIGAINFEDEEEIIEEKVGAIIIATGIELYGKENIGDYGGGEYLDVIDALQFERLNSASGPTAGKILRPSDKKEPKEVVFIQCVGSRSTESGFPYCSRICCMYTAKQAILYKRKVPEGRAYIFYIDIRSAGKNYEEFVQKGCEEEKILYLRGRVSKLFEEEGKIMVWGVDTLSGKKIEIKADLVVLATAITSSETAPNLSQKLKVSVDNFGYFQEVHPKLKPVETRTAGIYLAGTCTFSKDIPDTVSSAGFAAAKVIELLSAGKLTCEPYIAYVDEEICEGCGICITACPYEAREIDEKKDIAKVISALCQGCGACISVCPNKASQQKNLTTQQYLQMIETI